MCPVFWAAHGIGWCCRVQDSYLILRLDGDDRLEVMKAFEERAGIIDRAARREQAKQPD